MNKLCFVIMGFGKKTDYSIPKAYNMDITYRNIIKPVVESLGYRCVRADEILDSGLIDKSMFALLIKSDLVIADITTFNPNAIYELGIRHASKPFSTIVMKEQDGQIPFDLNHIRTFTYKHLGEDIDSKECERCKTNLKQIIMTISKAHVTDSPFYEFIPNVNPHDINDEIFESFLNELSAKENSIYSLTQRANCQMKDNNFVEAAKTWNQLAKLIPNDIYYMQQQALCLYKGKQPSVITACTEALSIIEKIGGKSSNNIETLGITGAIYKALWYETQDFEVLKHALDSYKKGFLNGEDYYTGENYAVCLVILANNTEGDKKIYYKYEARITCDTIINKLLKILESCETDINKWIYATLANCYLVLGNKIESEKYKNIFFSKLDAPWEKESYLKNMNIIDTCCN